ncbi:MAG: LytTR family DNA-binding domain-containing protein [Myxococcaceae bacterium]
MSPLRAVIADDEPPARRRLARMLESAGVEVVAEADDGLSALAAAQQHRPDVLFLDVRMPGLDGVTLAQRHGHQLPRVVFCTAYDEFAVRAFEVNAVDYLLKPVRPERLTQALDRLGSAAQRQGAQPLARTLEELAPAAASTRVVSSERGEVRFFDARAITRFWASDKYTVFLADGREHLTEEPLSDLEQRLAPLNFVRVHRGDLVRLGAVKSLRSTDGVHEVTLEDGQTARVSRRQLDAVKRALGA